LYGALGCDRVLIRAGLEPGRGSQAPDPDGVGHVTQVEVPGRGRRKPRPAADVRRPDLSRRRPTLRHARGHAPRAPGWRQ
jgi:hypothetical protein